MPNVPPRSPDRRRGDPIPIGDLLGLALPRRIRGRLLDLDFMRTLWARAAPEELAGRAVPARFEKRVLTVLADDPETRAEAHRRRTELARRLMAAAGLPDLRLRVRVELRQSGASALPGGER